MHDIDVTLERPTDARTQVAVCLLDGTQMPVRLRLSRFEDRRSRILKRLPPVTGAAEGVW